MRLKNYKPAGNEILFELKEYTTGVVIKIAPEHEKIMKILAVGPTVTIINPHTGKAAAPGDFAMLIAQNLLQLDFEPEKPGGKKIVCLQAKEYAIGSFYLPDDDETKFLPAYNPTPEAEVTRTMNVIDNPGIEAGSYLKEERDNQLKLNS